MEKSIKLQMNYFLAPRSGERSYKNFASTIRGGVNLERITPFLSEDEQKIIKREEVIYAWGNREGTRAQWEKMNSGDTVIFYANKKLVMHAEVYFKKYSPQLALALWPPDEKNNPWSYTFFLRNLQYIDIPIVLFNKIVGYQDNAIVQGFTWLNPQRVGAISKQFGSVEKLLSEFSAEHSYEAPKENEPLHVNVEQEVEVEVVPNQVVVHVTKAESAIISNTKKKINYLERARRNAITGSKGEELVLKEERKRLIREGRSDLAVRVKRVSIEDDSLGYDIHSFNADGTNRFIEVKTSESKSDTISFYLSSNEHKKALTLESYYIYYVDGLKSKPRITPFENPIRRSVFALRTDTFIAEGRRA